MKRARVLLCPVTSNPRLPPRSTLPQKYTYNWARQCDDYLTILCLFAYLAPVAVVICFFLCWAPFHAQRLIAIYSPARGAQWHDQHEFLYTVMTYVSGVLYYLSTCINPLLYNLMSNKFREAFRVSEELRIYHKLFLFIYCISIYILRLCCWARSIRRARWTRDISWSRVACAAPQLSTLPRKRNVNPASRRSRL